MALVLSPATLRFSDDAVERDYASSRNVGALLKAERNFMRLNGALYLLFILIEMLPGSKAPSMAVGMRLLGLTVAVVQFLVMEIFSKEIWARYRFFFITIFRTTRLIIFLNSVPLWVTDPLIDGTTLFRTAVLRTGLLVNVWYALGLPLLFTEHLVLHSVHVLVTVAFTSRPTCDAILETSASRRLFVHFWKCVNQVFMSLAGMPEYFSAHDDVDSMHDNLPQSCERLLIVAHLVLAFVLPTLLLWKMEVSSRQSYVQEINTQRRWGRLHLDVTWLPDIGRIVGRPLLAYLCVYVCLCSVLCCEYLCLLGLVYGCIKWGIN